MNRNTIFCVSFLFLSLMVSVKSKILTVESAPDIHQGDLILVGNNVTIIEGGFDINGSIIVEDNATLILRDAVLNLTQTEAHEFNITFHNPSNGNPSFLVENSSIEPNGYNLHIWLYENSSATFYHLTTGYPVKFLVYGNSTFHVSNSLGMRGSVYGYQHSVMTGVGSTFNTFGGYEYLVMDLLNCTVNTLVVNDRAEVFAENCSVTGYISIDPSPANLSIAGLKPGFFKYWNFEHNCSAESGYQNVNITLDNVEVLGWCFTLRGTSNASISGSTLRWLVFRSYASANISNSVISLWLDCHSYSICHVNDTVVDRVRSYDYAEIWFANSTSDSYDANEQSSIFLSWYLNAHVVDSMGQDVPSANVTATYPNATLADQVSCDGTGWARLTLKKMMNSTGEYPAGNYTIEATFSIYSDSTTINMTGNEQIELTLEGFVIPEYPLLMILPLFIIATSLATLLLRKRMNSLKP